MLEAFLSLLCYYRKCQELDLLQSFIKKDIKWVDRLPPQRAFPCLKCLKICTVADLLKCHKLLPAMPHLCRRRCFISHQTRQYRAIHLFYVLVTAPCSGCDLHLEKEGLAIIVGMKNFHQYINGELPNRP